MSRQWWRVLCLLMISASGTVSGLPAEEESHRVVVEFHGVSSFWDPAQSSPDRVVADPASGIRVLFPNLSDVHSFLDGRMHDGDHEQIATHQLRIYFSGVEFEALRMQDIGAYLGRGFPCHGHWPQPLPMLNVTEMFPYRDWELVVEDPQTQPASSSDPIYEAGLNLPRIDNLVWNWRSRKLDPAFLEGWERDDRKVLIGRLRLPFLRDDLQTAPFECEPRAGEEPEIQRIARGVRWVGTATSIALRSGDVEIDLPIGETGVRVIFENSPPKRQGGPCLGGTLDFSAHYNLLRKPKRRFYQTRHSVPDLVCRAGHDLGVSTNPQCSPAEVGP